MSETRELKIVSNQSEIAALGSVSHEEKMSQHFFQAQPSALVWASMFFAVSANVSWAFAYKVDEDSAD